VWRRAGTLGDCAFTPPGNCSGLCPLRDGRVAVAGPCTIIIYPASAFVGFGAAAGDSVLPLAVQLPPVCNTRRKAAPKVLSLCQVIDGRGQTTVMIDRVAPRYPWCTFS
jgi:hypothetical protein